MDVPRYSASPPCSFASSVQPVRRVASFSETVGAVMRWMTVGRHRRPLSSKRGDPAERGRSRSIQMRFLAQQAELQIIELIKTTPGLKTEIAKETGSKVNTTTQRLARMRERGLITRGDGGSGWAAAAPA